MLQTTDLQSHLDELAENSWTLLRLDLNWARQLAKLAKERLKQNSFKLASLSQSDQPVTQIRNDQILWLDAKNFTFDPLETDLLNQLENLKITLKNDFRIHLSELECHYAVYEPGHFYQRHADVTSTNNKRVFSFVIYLNENWRDEDEGELVGYPDKTTNPLFKIKPELGSMILFNSQLQHEVLLTKRQRLSLTGWFRKA